MPCVEWQLVGSILQSQELLPVSNQSSFIDDIQRFYEPVRVHCCFLPLMWVTRLSLAEVNASNGLCCLWTVSFPNDDSPILNLSHGLIDPVFSLARRSERRQCKIHSKIKRRKKAKKRIRGTAFMAKYGSLLWSWNRSIHELWRFWAMHVRQLEVFFLYYLDVTLTKFSGKSSLWELRHLATQIW